MRNAELKTRTFEAGVRVVRLVEALGKSSEPQVIGRQLLRSGTSIGANYRAAMRARSRAGFMAKLGIVEECDESIYWIDLLVALDFLKENRASALRDELDQTIAMVITSIKTARKNR